VPSLHACRSTLEDPLFVWFLKEKKLVPEHLFNEEDLKNIVKDFYKNKSSTNYYNAILQNLFFATLNRPINERKFAKDEGFLKNRNEYGIRNLYRYENMFLISEKDVIELFSSIPFVNGGLFDCLDDDMDIKSSAIDGFTRNDKYRAKIPDYLFFQKEEKEVDLSKYLKKAKKGTELEFVIMVIAVSCVKLLSAHNSTQHTSRKHKV
jgi:hypothetical protein